jgi:hypothetical protein
MYGLVLDWASHHTDCNPRSQGHCTLGKPRPLEGVPWEVKFFKKGFLGSEILQEGFLVK